MFNQMDKPQSGETIAVIHTNMGDISVRLFADLVPNTVENFVTHAKNGYYNGIIFHRVINDFMIQGGDPNGTGTGGQSIWGRPFEDEFTGELHNLRGALCMANAGPNTNGSQFFINNNNEITWSDAYLEAYEVPKEWWDAYKLNGGNPHLQDLYTVFGQVYDGQDVLDAVCGAETDDNDKPLQDVVIESIEITRYTK